MATLTGLRHSSLHVIGVGCSLIVLEVARHARSDSEVEVSIDVTLGAWRCDVHAGQRETCLAVIESRICPRSCSVTGGTSGRYSGLHVIRIGGALKIFHVTGGAVCRSAGILSVHVTLGTGHRDVRTGQRKLGKGVVIESRRLPGGRGVAALACLRESSLHVIRVCRLLEIGKVTADASRGCTRELASDMAGGAVQRNVGAGQGEAGHFQVVELGAGPGVHPVTLFAGSRKTGRHMIWTRGGLILLGMAGVTLGR